MELIDVRQALESGLIGSAIDLLTEEHLGDLRSTLEQMEAARDAGQGFAELNAESHCGLYAPPEYRTADRSHGRLLKGLPADPPSPGSGPVDLSELVRVHREIYEAVADKNKTLASERLQRHFDGIRQKLKDVAAR